MSTVKIQKKLVVLFFALSMVASSAQNPENKKITVSSKPDESRFTPVVLVQDLDEPMVFEVTKTGKVYIAERRGGLKVYDPITETTKVVTKIDVNTANKSAEGVVKEGEEGLIGMTIDPAFETNHWIYLYYSHPTEAKYVLTRWDVQKDQLVAGSNKDVLTVITQREQCCHTGGGMTWDNKGNLYLTTGNNTANQPGIQADERPGRSAWDDQGHSGNTNDLRGKILRIHPEPNGMYTIPAGNLFPVGTPKTRPEIYIMGNRNAWRPSIDSKTGFLYWGEIGPDANDDTEIGPRGYDELNQARKPGNFGWPWFVGNDEGYPMFDYTLSKPLQKKDSKNLTNTSPNNTGLTELPPTATNFIYYPYGVSEKFPEVGTGSRCAIGGPIYHRSDFSASAKRPFPDYYEGKWIVTDFSRGWIIAVTMDQNGDYKSMEKILTNYHPIEPNDIKFGPEGDLYVLEYGTTWYRKSETAKLVRVEYNSGNRKPFVEVATNRSGGSVPAMIKLSSAGTIDYDGDVLKYQWKVTPDAGGSSKTYTNANPEIVLDKPGMYTATLTVTDSKGLTNSKSVKVIAGNEPPVVDLHIDGNQTFFFPNKPVNYLVSVNDKEDGSIETGRITPEKVAVSIDYTSEGFDYAEAILGQRTVDASTRFAIAQALISQSDCKTCHTIDTKSVGPTFTQIAEKYKGDEAAAQKLAEKVRKGGSGVWGTGEVAMPAHPAITANDAASIVKYILSVNEKTMSTLPVKGSYTQAIPSDDNGKGSLILRAAYTDAGSKMAPSITGEHQLVLRSSQVSASSADIVNGAEIFTLQMGIGSNVIPNHNGYITFKNFDLTGVVQLDVTAYATVRDGNTGGRIEIRTDSPTGELVGQCDVKIPPNGGNGFGIYRGPAIQVDIKETSKQHDLYFVFKNDTAKPSDPLFIVSTIKFKTEKN